MHRVPVGEPGIRPAVRDSVGSLWSTPGDCPFKVGPATISILSLSEHIFHVKSVASFFRMRAVGIIVGQLGFSLVLIIYHA